MKASDMTLAQNVSAIRELEAKIKDHPLCASFHYLPSGKAIVYLTPGDCLYKGVRVHAVQASLAKGKVNALTMILDRLEKIWSEN